MNRLLRIPKHRYSIERDLARTLDDALPARIEARVAATRSASGEIRVCAGPTCRCPYLWRGASARERALAMFGKLRVWDTEHNNGVLIYLLLAEHRIEIVADRGLDRHVSASQWRNDGAHALPPSARVSSRLA